MTDDITIPIFQCESCKVTFRGDEFTEKPTCPACHKNTVRIIARSNMFFDELFEGCEDADDPFLEAKLGGDR